MLKKFLQEYIDDLYNKQNMSAFKEQQGLFTKKDYYELLLPVVQLITKYKDYSINELRQILFEKSGLEEKIKDFVYHKEMTPGIVLSYGTKKYRETIVVGNKSEVTVDDRGNLVPNVTDMTEDTIFDLASTTKIFTSLSILKLVQLGAIKLSDPIIKWEPRFKNLKDVTIFDLISFKTPVITDARIDGILNLSEAEDTIFTMHINENFIHGTNPYTDMGAIVLKYVIESATGLNYYKFVEENILKPLNMDDTYANVPKMKLNRLASTNFESRVFDDGKIINFPYVKEGEVNDPKARALGHSQGILSGHAGLFSTAKDMTNFAKGVIDRKIINDEYIEKLVKNRTGEKFLKNGKEQYIQYLGFLCYSKNPILANSELFHAMSGKSFAIGGYTGTQLTVDPINELFLFMGSNRVHNRVSYVAPNQRKNIKYDEFGKGIFVMPDGQQKVTSYSFAWDRDNAAIHPALKLSIQYKMLEDIYTLYNEKIEVSDKARKF